MLGTCVTLSCRSPFSLYMCGAWRCITRFIRLPCKRKRGVRPRIMYIPELYTQRDTLSALGRSGEICWHMKRVRDLFFLFTLPSRWLEMLIPNNLIRVMLVVDAHSPSVALFPPGHLTLLAPIWSHGDTFPLKHSYLGWMTRELSEIINHCAPPSQDHSSKYFYFS